MNDYKIDRLIHAGVRHDKKQAELDKYIHVITANSGLLSLTRLYINRLGKYSFDVNFDVENSGFRLLRNPNF